MLPTTASVSEQRDALFRRVGEMVEAAGRSGVNVLCLQEAWSEFALLYREMCQVDYYFLVHVKTKVPLHL